MTNHEKFIKALFTDLNNLLPNYNMIKVHDWNIAKTFIIQAIKCPDSLGSAIASDFANYRANVLTYTEAISVVFERLKPYQK